MNKTTDNIATERYENPLGYEKISKLLYQFSVPAIIGMTINALYNVVDRMFIGNSPDLGPNGLAALTICFPAMIIIMSIGILFGQGGATLFSINLGKGNIEKADKTLGNATFMLIASGIIITILGEIFIDDLLILFGSSETILPFAKEYMRIVFIGTTFQVIAMGMNNFLRADGKPKLSMMTMFLGAIINIILDPIFIYGFHMGMFGAALATIIGQIVSMVWSIQHFIKRDSVHRIEKKYLKFDPNLSFEIISLGMPGFFLQLANSALSLLLNHSLAKYGGDIAISGMGIVNSVQTLLILPIIGMNQGLQPIVSFNYGAGKIDRVKKAVKLAIIAATIIAVIGFVLVRAVPTVIVSAFNRDPELMEFSTFALKTWLLFLPVTGFQIIASNFFQAIEKPKVAMFLTSTRQVIFLMPCIVVLSSIFKLEGILYSAPVADLSSATITFIIFMRFIKKLGVKNENMQQHA